MKGMKRVIALAITLAFAASLPLYIPEAFIYLLGLALLFAILVVSWDVMVGYTGYVNLGHTVFVGIGAYTAALLQSQRLALPTLPVPASIVMGGFIAALVGLFIGIVTLRLRGYYFALVTAILPLVFMQTVFIWPDIFGGEEGFTIEHGLAGSVVEKYYAALLIAFVSIAVMLLIVNSPVGLKLKAIREDEELAEAVGIDTVKYKIMAFVISSFFAGIGGAAIVHYRMVVAPDLYDIPLMLLVILSAVIGGLGTIYGPMIGGLLIYLAKNWWLKEVVDVFRFTALPINDDVILYLILIVVAILMPEGVYQGIKEKLKKERG
ncbi:MAG: branched-chain amino acid ABC transporter permease [Archaeoglobales archaeon]|nr:MAG: branched-chain amino acid ABC transporter permease [Archaeoglobales archaeon]